MKKDLIKLAFILGAGALIWLGYFAYENLRGIGPAILPPGQTAEPGPGGNTTGMPLKLPDGFSVSVFAKNVPGARVMRFDQDGNLWVSQTSRGQVSVLYIENGKVTRQLVPVTGLRNPHGIVFDPQDPSVIYIAEEHQITKRSLADIGHPQKLVELPGGTRLTGGGHMTRTLGFGPDGRLYVSIGSSCNVCNESDDRRAKIFSLNKDGTDFKEVARGLRNAVFFNWRPDTDELWTTEMGRDLLGDDIPPDEINIVEAGKNYGWPICYGKNIHDTNFDKNTYIRNPCMEPFEQPSHIDLQAHSAPLGLAFTPQDAGWPEEYKDDLFVAFHGSWNRSVPTGYKIARMKLDGKGRYGGTDDFITGWFPAGGTGTSAALGRPADIIFSGGAMYVSDDKAGIIYQVVFGAAPVKPPTGGCFKGGCSGEICSDRQDVASVCIYREEFACYRTAECGRQADGLCGWTTTAELTQCLKQF